MKTPSKFPILHSILLVASLFFLGVPADVSQAAEKPLRVLTYNVWQLPFGSKDRAERNKDFVSRVVLLDADIIALQEVWPSYFKRRYIKEFKEAGYPYSQRVAAQALFPHGILGNGLLLVSRLPLETPDLESTSFTQNTRDEEWLARKGAMHTVVKIRDNVKIDFYTTHLGSVDYLPERSDFDQGQGRRQSVQFKELAAFIKKSKTCDTQILAGDFNLDQRVWDSQSRSFLPDSLNNVVSLFETQASLWSALRPFGGSQAFPSYGAANPYAGPEFRQQDLSYNLDHIYYSQNSKLLTPVSAQLVLQEPLPQTNKPLSDHFGITVDFEISNF